MARQRNASLTFIFITILIDVIGLGIIIPVLPSLIESLTGEGLSKASMYGGWLIFAYALMQFLFAPVLGELSDQYGRRPVLLIALLGLGIDYLFHAWAPTLGWLFVGRIIAGISGASFTVATAYIADISEPEKKAQNFGLVGAAFGLGFIIGPVIGGLFSQWGIRLPFLVAAGLSLLNFLYGFFFIPESLPKDRRRSFEWKRANSIGSLMHLKKYPMVLGLIFSFFFAYIAAHSVQSTWSYYTMFRFEWDETMVGYSLGVVGALVAVVQGGLIRLIVPKIGERNAVIAGFILWATGLLGFAFAFEGWMMFVILIPYCLGGIASPTVQGIISNQVPPNEQGELQGALTSLISITSIVGPLLMTNLFYFFSREDAPFFFPGAPFMMGALLILLGLLIAIPALSRLK
ncbi:MAG: MFS transporter [Bacteroidetes bacterium]|nr:MAG: MFS transporter [Bacteroidota bacterium]